MYSKVLLAYDGSVEGRLALREGARIAQICGAEVLLLAVVDTSLGLMLAEGAAPGLTDQECGAYQEVLDEGARRLRAMGFASPATRLGVGDTAQQIAEAAKEIGADLVVVGHRQQGAFARWWTGSTAASLLDCLGCSLLVSRKEISDEVFFSKMQAPATA